MAGGTTLPLSLAAAGEWDTLRTNIDPKKTPAAERVLHYARTLGAVSAIVEEEYLDQDFTAEYATFYSHLFRRYTKLCKRIHFFAADVAPILNQPEAERLTKELQDLAD